MVKSNTLYDKLLSKTKDTLKYGREFELKAREANVDPMKLKLKR